MPTPTSKGQYRRVRYADDGCTIYQCLWCLGTIEVRDDPQYGWHFCPKCGKSWFDRMECRESGVPRWFYDRYGNHGPLEVRMHPASNRATHEWYFESRYRWGETEKDPAGGWSKWSLEFAADHDKLGDHKWAFQSLQRLRDKHTKHFGGLEHQYRVTLRRKIS